MRKRKMIDVGVVDETPVDQPKNDRGSVDSPTLIDLIKSRSAEFIQDEDARGFALGSDIALKAMKTEIALDLANANQDIYPDEGYIKNQVELVRSGAIAESDILYENSAKGGIERLRISEELGLERVKDL